MHNQNIGKHTWNTNEKYCNDALVYLNALLSANWYLSNDWFELVYKINGLIWFTFFIYIFSSAFVLSFQLRLCYPDTPSSDSNAILASQIPPKLIVGVS